MSVVIEVIAPRLLGPALMVGAALIVKGYTDVGDGFSAGVIVALAIALRYIALGRERAERSLPILRHAPAIAAGGLLVALAVGFFPVLARRPAVHPPAAARARRWCTIGTLELITAVAFDVGLFLLVTGVLVTLVHQLADARPRGAARMTLVFALAASASCSAPAPTCCSAATSCASCSASWSSPRRRC